MRRAGGARSPSRHITQALHLAALMLLPQQPLLPHCCHSSTPTPVHASNPRPTGHAPRMAQPLHHLPHSHTLSLQEPP